MNYLTNTEIEASWQDFIKRTQSALQFRKELQSNWVTLANAPQNPQGLPARTHYLRWPKPNSSCIVIMAGGIVNIAHRFRFLAESLSDDFECIAYDWYGRGYSDWLGNAKDYSFSTNVQQTAQFVAQLSEGRPVVFLGSSLGGLVAMALPLAIKQQFKGLVLNDVGPTMLAERRIRRAAALAIHRVFSDPQVLLTKLGAAEKNAGYIPQWIRDYLSLENTTWYHEGQSRQYRYDMACMSNYVQQAKQDINLWSAWLQIQCSQLLLHGKQSDALSDEQVQQMISQAGSKLTLVEFAHTGHTPSLCLPEQTKVILDWL